jgi:tRNA threonylcarbamoyladenosine biosynthesis protein TsaE
MSTATAVVRLAHESVSQALGAGLAVAFATRFARTPADAFHGFTIHLSGELGTGKTTIVRAMLRRLGVTGPIKSPTYALVEPYMLELSQIGDLAVESRQKVKLHCYHFDFYRFEDPREWLDAGFRDEFADAALRLVEWPERAVGPDGSLLPAPDLAIVLAHDGAGRVATVSAGTSLGVAWMTTSPLLVGVGAPSAASPPASPPSSR